MEASAKHDDVVQRLTTVPRIGPLGEALCAQPLEMASSSAAAATWLHEPASFRVSIRPAASHRSWARRTLYNQFPAGKEELFRAVVERVWSAFPVLDIVAEAETLSDPDIGLRRIASAVASFWEPPLAISFLRMVIAEGPRFPDLTESFFKHGKTPEMNAVRAYIEKQGELGVLSIKDGERAARQFLGLIDEPLLWIRVLGREEKFTRAERRAVIDEAVDIFLGHYRVKPKARKA
ncbi:Putative TetR family transcriptional regulatory protein [Paraburkholderia phenoliruptrix BR3459a]|uniref:Putative TetR family transcriptional regulatory protein n=1 Tax=Paraburkholderia phenoliruptrix BR3459a TaxID=1229205 RepID=K0DQ93_9BURK|nr:Putative TetR family transcriptional regulatory protein [Paraburkholderia phenoliruptrix BR3459a]